MDCQYSDTLQFASLRLARRSIPLLDSTQRGALALRLPATADVRAPALVGLLPDSLQPDRVAAWGRSDSAGTLMLAPVPPGPYVVRVSQIGYEPFQRAIAVRQGYIDTLLLRERLAECRRPAG